MSCVHFVCIFNLSRMDEAQRIMYVKQAQYAILLKRIRRYICTTCTFFICYIYIYYPYIFQQCVHLLYLKSREGHALAVEENPLAHADTDADAERERERVGASLNLMPWKIKSSSRKDEKT